MKNEKLLSKANIFVVTLVVLVVFILMAFYSRMVNSILKQQTQDKLMGVCEQDAMLVKARVRDGLGAIRDMAIAIGTYGRDINTVLPMLVELSEKNGFKRMGIVDARGYAYVTDGDNSDPKSLPNLSDRDWFIEALKGELYISNAMEDRISKGKIVVYSAPIKIDGKIEGVLFATISVSDYQQILNFDSFGGDGITHIVTSKGDAIAPSLHPNANKMENNIYELAEPDNPSHIDNFDKIVRDMKREVSNFLEFTANGQKRFMYYTPIGVNDWYILSIVPATIVTVRTSIIMGYTGLLFIIVILLFTVLLFYNLIVYKKSKSELHKLAYYDELTGAPNVAHFKADLPRILNNYATRNFMIIKMDISKFKSINQIIGHDAGDRIIKIVSDTIKELITHDYTAYARVGADEFIILDSVDFLADDTEETLIVKYNKRNQDFQKRVTERTGFVNGHKIQFRFGRYVLQKGETDIESIWEKVNLAHHISKNQSINYICDYKTEFKKRLVREVELENRLSDAMEKDEFKLFVQPKYRISDEKIVGGESLVRWFPDDGSKIYPNEFIPIFEKNGTICMLDFRMLEKTCEMLAGMLANSIRTVCISVNFSRVHITSETFLSDLCSIVDRYNVPHDLIELEITESAAIEDEKGLLKFLDDVHNSGFTLAMDDFGSGYSSLGSLKNMPIDTLKLDRSFFTNAIDDSRTSAVVESVAYLTQKLKIKTVAEGIEVKSQIDMLKSFGFDVVQGYYYAKPMPCEEFVEMLKNN